MKKRTQLWVLPGDTIRFSTRVVTIGSNQYTDKEWLIIAVVEKNSALDSLYDVWAIALGETEVQHIYVDAREDMSQWVRGSINLQKRRT